MLFKNERCFKMHMCMKKQHEERLIPEYFFLPFYLLLISVAQTNPNTAEAGRLHLMGPSLRLKEDYVLGATDLLQSGGKAAAAWWWHLCWHTLSGQSDSGNSTEAPWDRVCLAVSAPVVLLRAPQRMNPWRRRLPCAFCSFSKLYCALLIVSTYFHWINTKSIYHPQPLSEMLARRFRKYECWVP